MIESFALIAAEGGGHVDVAAWKTYLFAALLAGLIACLALEEKLHAKKSIIAGGFATVSMFLGAALLPIDFLPQSVVIGGHTFTMPIYIPAVDWGVITIILGSSLFVDVTSRSGLFTWIAIRLTKASRGDPLLLLWAYGIMTVVFSAVLNNVTAMLIVGALTGVSLKKLGRMNMLLGFLLIEALLTNIGGLLTLISSVPNIIVGTTAGISFVSFFIKAAPYTVVATVVTIAMGAKVFGIRRLASDEERARAADQVAGFDENDGIQSRAFFWFGAVMLGLFIVAIATASVLPAINELGMGWVALAFAFIMLLRFKHEASEFYKAVDWDLLGFFAALFAVIFVMEEAGVLALIGKGLAPLVDLGASSGSAAVLVSSAVASSVTDNIPLAAMLAKILAAMPLADGSVRGPDDPMWWAVIFGANLGGNITPIGSASTLVAVAMIHRYGIKLSFMGFVTKAVGFAAVQIVLAVVYVVLVVPWLPSV